MVTVTAKALTIVVLVGVLARPCSLSLLAVAEVAVNAVLASGLLLITNMMLGVARARAKVVSDCHHSVLIANAFVLQVSFHIRLRLAHRLVTLLDHLSQALRSAIGDKLDLIGRVDRGARF